MPRLRDIYDPPPELVLGKRLNVRIPEADQKRQRAEVAGILNRLRNQPGVILADEVGMGKTFVALAIAYCFAVSSQRGPVIVMVPANLVDKWEQDLKTFCELYLDTRHPVRKDLATPAEITRSTSIRRRPEQRRADEAARRPVPRAVPLDLPAAWRYGAPSDRQVDQAGLNC